MTINIKVKRKDTTITLPSYKTTGAAGFDIEVLIGSKEGGYLELLPNEIVKLDTGLSFEIPNNTELQLRLRSSAAAKGLLMLNAPATIDADYRGEVAVILTNITKTPIKIYHKDRLIQGIVSPIARLGIIETDTLTATERGSGGFGSTN